MTRYGCVWHLWSILVVLAASGCSTPCACTRRALLASTSEISAFSIPSAGPFESNCAIRHELFVRVLQRARQHRQGARTGCDQRQNGPGDGHGVAARFCAHGALATDLRARWGGWRASYVCARRC